MNVWGFHAAVAAVIQSFWCMVVCWMMWRTSCTKCVVGEEESSEVCLKVGHVSIGGGRGGWYMARLWFKVQILIIISLMTYLGHLNLVHFCHLIPEGQNVPGNNYEHMPTSCLSSGVNIN